MDYQKHYSLLINRAIDRQLIGYVEIHHILPRCMGGSDDKDNLVSLTPEEHYVAHLLLVKIYPEEPKLLFAVHRMTHKNQKKLKNRKMYGWVRRKFVDAVSESMSEKQRGVNNSQYGTIWIHNNSESKKIGKNEEIPDGWVKGRYYNSTLKEVQCKNCGKLFVRQTPRQRVCCKEEKGKRYIGREEELIEHLTSGKSLSESLSLMGLKFSNTKAGVGKWAKEVKDRTIS